MYIEVSPAYGRDYKSKKEVLAAWNAELDFRDNATGQYLSKRDIDLNPDFRVIIRYDNNRKVMNV